MFEHPKKRKKRARVASYIVNTIRTRFSRDFFDSKRLTIAAAAVAEIARSTRAECVYNAGRDTRRRNTDACVPFSPALRGYRKCCVYPAVSPPRSAFVRFSRARSTAYPSYGYE